MYRLLVAVADDEPRRDRLVDAITSRPCAAENLAIVIANVDEGVDVPADGEGGVVDEEALFDADAIPAVVREIAVALEEADIEVTVRRAFGYPAKEILGMAEDVGADEILLGGRRRSPTGKALFGSVTQTVILDADRPVTVLTGE